MDFISLSIDGERKRADQAFGLEEGIAREGDSGQRRGEKKSLGNGKERKRGVGGGGNF